MKSEVEPSNPYEYEQYRRAVSYHLQAALNSQQAASSSLHTLEWTLNVKGTIAILNNFEPEQLVHHGDIAIREATSALETTLCLVNYVLDLGEHKRQVGWLAVGGREKGLKRKLRESERPYLNDVHNAIDSVYNSVGYSLLRDYRNWVTHRGAPHVLFSNGFSKLVPLPEDIIETKDKSQKDWLISHHLLTTLRKQITIACWPFVPPVALTYAAKIDEAKEDIGLPGLHIGKGCKDITVEDMRVSSGSLSNTTEVFKERNPKPLELGHRKVAGEDLALYTAADYLQAVKCLVHYIQSALSSALDDILYRTYGALRDTASNT